jgi:hypothetical protein
VANTAFRAITIRGVVSALWFRLATLPVPRLTWRAATAFGVLVVLHPGFVANAALGVITVGGVVSALRFGFAPLSVPRLAWWAAASFGVVVVLHARLVAYATFGIGAVGGIAATLGFAVGRSVIPGGATRTAARLGPVVIVHIRLGTDAAPLGTGEGSITTAVVVCADGQIDGVAALCIWIRHGIDDAPRQCRGQEETFQKHGVEAKKREPVM